MSDSIFPSNIPGITWECSKKPLFSTIVRTSASGRELRASMQSYPTWMFTRKYEFLRDSMVNGVNELKVIVGFFLLRMGSFDSFLYEDPDDNSVIDQQVAIGNGTTKTFQLVRSFGGFLEPTMNVKAITDVKIDGVATTEYVHGTLGRITFNDAPGVGEIVSWSGSYYFRCRFNDDDADFEQFLKKFWQLKKLEFRGSLGDKIA